MAKRTKNPDDLQVTTINLYADTVEDLKVLAADDVRPWQVQARILLREIVQAKMAARNQKKAAVEAAWPPPPKPKKVLT